MSKLQPVEGEPGKFRTASGAVIHLAEWFPRFFAVKTPWIGRPPQGSDWVILDVQTADEDMTGTVRLTDAERNRLLWEADKRALVLRDLRQREITPGMRDAAAYLEGVAETMSEFVKDADAVDVIAMTDALQKAAAAWRDCYKAVTDTEKIPDHMLRGDLPRVYKLDVEGSRPCELHLVILERRPVT